MSGLHRFDQNSGSYRLAVDYNIFQASVLVNHAEIWGSFEKKIHAYPSIVQYIMSNSSLDSHASFKDKFSNVLSMQGNGKEGMLRHLIFSIPDLEDSFQEYNRKMWENYNWEVKISTYPSVRAEFAAFIGRSHNWLAATELLLIAYAFNKTIHYFPAPDPAAEMMELNPKKSEPIIVQFNGIDHFERIQSNMICVQVIDIPTNIPTDSSTQGKDGKSEKIVIKFIDTGDKSEKELMDALEPVKEVVTKKESKMVEQITVSIEPINLKENEKAEQVPGLTPDIDEEEATKEIDSVVKGFASTLNQQATQIAQKFAEKNMSVNFSPTNK